MLKKFFYFGVGLASLIYENFDELVQAGEKRYNQYVKVDHPPEETIEIETTVSDEIILDVSENEQDAVEPDDLTAINGIGPTFSKRLQEAGITTYSALAGSSEDQIREITGVADWQADPHDWIVEAAARA